MSLIRAAPTSAGALRIQRLAAAALVVVASLFTIGVVLTYQHTSDLPAFLRGARQLADGLTPYGDVPEPYHEFLYAPWFAVAMIPATWLPFPTFAIVWHGFLAAGTAFCVWPLFRSRTLEGVLAGSLIGAFSFHGVWAGHYESLLVALLVWALPTRWGPVAVGVAASIKITPIVLCIRYAGRGEWRQVVLAVATAAILWAPALLFDLQGWGVGVGHTLSLLGYSPILWGLTGATALGTAFVLARTRYGWLFASVAWLAVLPRVLLYDVTGLAVAAVELRPRQDTKEAMG